MTTANSAYAALTEIFEASGRLQAAERLLFWESRTMMPPGGAHSRAKVLAALRTAANESMAAPRVAQLLERAESEELPGLDTWEAANLREMRRQWRAATVIPLTLQAAIVERSGAAQTAWASARARDDFAGFLEPLRTLLTLQMEAARIKAEEFRLSPYDALLDGYEPGLRTASIDPMFDELAAFLPELVRKIALKRRAEGPPITLPGPFDVETQRLLSERLAKTVGFDFQRGRLDATLHPFTAAVPGDIRITTRFSTDDPLAAIIATVHESGHAMYEAGLPEKWQFQPVGAARGGAAHESQSLLFEMQAARSLPFLHHLAPLLRAAFAGAGPAWSDENILRLYRRVVPTPIRVEADEVTYPLHIILRYRIERALLAGDLAVADIPRAWRSESERLLGIAPPSDALGCLQDIHWAMGLFGYFPTYTLGALSAAQLFSTLTRARPDIPAALGRGDFSPLLQWTRQHIHRWGSYFPTNAEMLQRATGGPLATTAFKSHLTARYLEE